jgi:cytidylate kinase
MDTTIGVERCLAFISSQAKSGEPAATVSAARAWKLTVAIARQTGSGAHAVAERLANWLQARAPAPKGGWTVFDRNLVEKVLEDHHLPQKLAQFMPEDRISQMDDIMQEVLGLRPASWTLVHQTTETILALAELGGVILMGRGVNVIASRLEHVLHVRLVGSLPRRVERVRAFHGYSERQALEFIEREDRGRERYLQTYFSARATDPLLYHLTLNTDRIPLEEAALVIGETALRVFPPPRP